ncbi:hypothetical protein BW898_26105 [Bacillus cereus]|nr:hypothetical protein BW898_26105 [Bacillus cereus]
MLAVPQYRILKEKKERASYGSGSPLPKNYVFDLVGDSYNLYCFLGLKISFSHPKTVVASLDFLIFMNVNF